jgi:preprotein translocase subunit YajC
MTVAILYFVVLAAAFFLLIVRPQRRRAAAHNALVQAVETGDEVITTGGIFGVVREVGEETVDLEVSPGVVLHLARQAIAQRVPEDLADGADGTDNGAADPPAGS